MPGSGGAKSKQAPSSPCTPHEGWGFAHQTRRRALRRRRKDLPGRHLRHHRRTHLAASTPPFTPAFDSRRHFTGARMVSRSRTAVLPALVGRPQLDRPRLQRQTHPHRSTRLITSRTARRPVLYSRICCRASVPAPLGPHRIARIRSSHGCGRFELKIESSADLPISAVSKLR